MNSNKKMLILILTIPFLFLLSCSKEEPTAPSSSNKITVMSPNGGENFLTGSSNAITWTDNINDEIKIDLYKGGSILYTIISSTSSGGQYTWTIPDTIQSGTDYRIKLTSVVNNSINDLSDGDFSIEKPSIQVFNNEYTGWLELHFTNQYPAFDETVQVDVDIDKYGNVTFGTGTLTYSGDDNNGQSRIVRNGTIQLSPTGYYFDNNGADYIAVDENATLNENLIVYYWDGTQWVEALNENITETWHGGYAFSIDDAVIGGSIIQVVTAQGSVTWGLYLVVVP